MCRAPSGDGGSRGSGVDCLAPGCRHSTPEHSHHHHDHNTHQSYCSDACLLKTTPHLAKALGGVRTTLSSAWVQRLLNSSGKGSGQKPTPLLRNLTSFHSALLDMYTSTPLITPKQQEAGMRGASSKAPLLSTLSAVLSDLSEQPPTLAKAKPQGSFDSASTTVRPTPSPPLPLHPAAHLTPLFVLVFFVCPPLQGVKKKEALPVDQRERVRHALRETFLKGLQRLNDEASAASRCALLAWELELELTRLIGPQDTPEKKEAFRKKYMSLKFNLDDPKNPQVPHTNHLITPVLYNRALHHLPNPCAIPYDGMCVQLMEKVVNGVISMDQLCRMPASELASQEIKVRPTPPPIPPLFLLLPVYTSPLLTRRHPPTSHAPLLSALPRSAGDHGQEPGGGQEERHPQRGRRVLLQGQGRVHRGTYNLLARQRISIHKYAPPSASTPPNPPPCPPSHRCTA